MIAKFLGSDRLFCFISVSKFGSFKNPFAMITSLSELSFRFRIFILLVKTKVISMNYCCNTSSWKPWRWVRFDLTFSMKDINSKLYLLTKITRSRSAQFKGIFPWNISQMIAKTIPISAKIVISYTMKQHPNLSLTENQWRSRQHHDQNFPIEGKSLQNKY